MKRYACIIALLLCTSGCEAFLQAIPAILQVADLGQRVYFNRHPHPTHRAAVEAALAVLAMAHRSGDEQAVSDAYAALYNLLDETGVLRATSPEGGAEGSGPTPVPLDLPTPLELSQGD